MSAVPCLNGPLSLPPADPGGKPLSLYLPLPRRRSLSLSLSLSLLCMSMSLCLDLHVSADGLVPRSDICHVVYVTLQADDSQQCVGRF